MTPFYNLFICNSYECKYALWAPIRTLALGSVNFGAVLVQYNYGHKKHFILFLALLQEK